MGDGARIVTRPGRGSRWRVAAAGGLVLVMSACAATQQPSATSSGVGPSNGPSLSSRADPANRSDAVGRTPCVNDGAASNAWPNSAAPIASRPRDPAREDSLPKTISGHPTNRTSVTGPTALQDQIFSPIVRVLIACLGKQDSDGAYGVAGAQGIEQGVMAVRIKGATGSQMERGLLAVYPGQLDPVPPTVRTIQAKTYRVYINDFMVYTSWDTLYFSFAMPDPNGNVARPPEGSATVAPIGTPMSSLAVFDDIVRQLP